MQSRMRCTCAKTWLCQDAKALADLCLDMNHSVNTHASEHIVLAGLMYWGIDLVFRFAQVSTPAAEA